MPLKYTLAHLWSLQMYRTACLLKQCAVPVQCMSTQAPVILNIHDEATQHRFEAAVSSTQSGRPGSLTKRPVSKHYAVLVPLINVQQQPSLILTVRSSDLNDHRREVSFPGGRVESGESYVDAALRETYEEIGLDKGNVTVWAQMPPTLTRNLEGLVHPIVGVVDESVDIDELTPHVQEVASIFTATIQSITTRGHFGYTQFRYNGSIPGYSLPYFEGPPRIWGLSAVILHQILKILVPDRYTGLLKFSKPLP